MGASYKRLLQGLCQRSPAALWVLSDRLPGATYTLIQQHSERLGVRMHLSATDPSPSVEVAYEGWTFPKGGVAFVWVLEREVGTKKAQERSVDP
ncbi:hypothetical protein AB0I99_17210 [Streptomyces spongiicola]|uniref:Uncharacterized protein n=1 Tax=Streptomyces spongiicola TaxID=1690221 RepID=A0ABN5KQ42_9ACTN|nr:hypothetical protein [Streptomyces spongiicola]AWK10755.1 hypothetical protein DDQ41_19705 [Streptomyces spongiicola]